MKPYKPTEAVYANKKGNAIIIYIDRNGKSIYAKLKNKFLFNNDEIFINI